MTAAKICIVGAGAIGGYLAVRLARAGNQVSVIARGAQLAAIRSRGLTLIDAEGGRETAAGLKSPVLDNIRSEIWLKLWGNCRSIRSARSPTPPSPTSAVFRWAANLPQP